MRRSIVLALGAVWSATSLHAQSDPLSGKWGRDGATVLDLKLANDGAVTGQVMNGRAGNMAPVKSGSFTRNTGALKLEGDAPASDGIATPYSIVGTLVGDSLNVNAIFGSFRGSLVLRKLPSDAAAPALNEEVTKAFNEVHAAIVTSADMVPADKYTSKPVATVRTFGQLVAHIADSYVWYCTRASGRNVEWSDAIEKGKTDKTTVTQKLRESVALCSAAYGNSSSNSGALISNMGHANLHYGNIITYLRMMGLVPPTS